MAIRSLRGAITVATDSSDAIEQATRELLQALIESNQIEPGAVVAAIFSATPDLTAAYPAAVARAMGWTHASLMCLQEMAVAGSLERCLRVLILLESDHSQATMRHCYLGGARGLRPDLE